MVDTKSTIVNKMVELQRFQQIQDNNEMEKQLLAVTKEIIEIQKQVNARDIVTGKVLD